MSPDLKSNSNSEIATIFRGRSVLLDITPQIDSRGYITLRINPSISEFKYTEDAVKQTQTRDLPPDTVTRRISSVVRVKDGDSIILGGLISSTKGEQENKIRLLGDIPYLGRLFKSTTTTDIVTEIVFVLTPYLSDAQKMPSLSELGFGTLATDHTLHIASKAGDTNQSALVAVHPDPAEDADRIPYERQAKP